MSGNLYAECVDLTTSQCVHTVLQITVLHTMGVGEKEKKKMRWGKK